MDVGKLLIEAGADPNLKAMTEANNAGDEQFITAHMIAIARNHPEFSKLLAGSGSRGALPTQRIFADPNTPFGALQASMGPSIDIVSAKRCMEETLVRLNLVSPATKPTPPTGTK